MDLSQTKLTKTEWNNIEIPPEESKSDSSVYNWEYSNVNLKRNANLSLISIAKIDPNPRSIINCINYTLKA
jgi:hypothetical protein